ncbi:MAG: S1 RNA-binding domain-containing protein [Clostridiales Family XIII bacterium]|jgi:hypothetical protein|nr:S1 RNA-binding domain-containing protein [Clostridiales Family XIII bacterium]
MLKKEIENELKAKGIEFDKAMTKAELVTLLENCQEEEAKAKTRKEGTSKKEVLTEGTSSLPVNKTGEEEEKTKEDEPIKNELKESPEPTPKDQKVNEVMSKEELLKQARNIAYKNRGLISGRKRGVLRQRKDKSLLKNVEADIARSKQTKEPLGIKLVAVKLMSLGGKEKGLCGVGYYGEYEVIIPLPEFFDMGIKPFSRFAESEGDKKEEKENKQFELRLKLEGRLDSDVKFLPLAIDEENKKIYGSRIKAMEVIRNRYWWGVDKSKGGNEFLLNQGKRVEASVVNVFEKGAIFEVFGIESYIPKEQLSYGSVNPKELYKTGDKETVQIKSVERRWQGKNPKDIKVLFNIKEIKGDSRAVEINRIEVGDVMLGEITYIQTEDKHREDGTISSSSGIFVKIGGIQIKCRLLHWRTPQIGDKVKVKVIKKDEKTLFLWGDILRLL